MYIARRFPTHLVATANGVNAVLVGISAAAAMFVGGYLWEALKALSYLPMAGMSLLALVIFLVAVRRQTRPLQAEQGLALPITATTP